MFAGCQPYLFSSLKPEYVAQRIVNGVRANREEVILPGIMGLFIFLIAFLPAKCQLPFFDLAGGREMMANFTGRKLEKKKLVE